MIQAILQKIGIAILALTITIATILGVKVERQIEEPGYFGAIRFVAGERYKLAGSGISSSDTTIQLRSFKTRDGRELTMSNFGEIGYATLEPGSSNMEFISFTGITQDANSDKATLTGVTRGLDFIYPYTASSTLAKPHAGGTVLIISNPPQLYNEAAFKKNDESITGTWTFASSAIPRLDSYKAPTSDSEFAPKKYADDLAIAGAPAGTWGTAGIFKLATSTELTVGTATSSDGYYLIVPNQFFAQTSTASVLVPVTGSDGKIDQGFLDLTESWTFSGTTTFSGDITMSGDLTVSGTSSLATTTFSVIPTLPSSDPTSDNEAARKKYVDDQIATRTKLYSTSTQVFNGTSPTNFTDLDLSSYIGSTTAMVYLLVYNGDNAAAHQFAFRTNGETTDVELGRSISISRAEYVWILTDSNGVIEWRADAANAVTITLKAYLK